MYNIENAVIIGITGRQGKTSTAYLVHKYLKSLGKKSILYSSCLIDSPAGYRPADGIMEFTFYKESQIVNILQEAVAYEAEYIIIECWEDSIANGVFDNIPFDIKCLTKFFYTTNGHLTSEQVYQNKLKFFKDEEDAICIFNIVGEDYCDAHVANFLADCNASNIVLCDSIGFYNYDNNYKNFFDRKINIKNLGYSATDVKYYAKNRVEALTEQSETLILNNKEVNINTTLATTRHLENILTAAAILCEANAFNEEAFVNFISNSNLQIPGRFEDLSINDKIVIIDQAIDGALLELKNYVNQGNKLIFVASYNLSNNCLNEKFRQAHPERSFEYNFDYIPNEANLYADFVYITTENTTEYTPEQITAIMASKLTVPYEIICDRKTAIEIAIANANAGDIIAILGRGNRKMMFTDYYHFVNITDRQIVEEIINKEVNNEEL